MPSDLTGTCRFISSISSSSDIQPSETMGVLSADACLVLLDASCVDIFARTFRYRRILASWAGNTADGAGVPFCGTRANISTRWLQRWLAGGFICAKDKNVERQSPSCDSPQCNAFTQRTYFDVCATTFCRASVSRWTSCGSAWISPACWSAKLP